jgi:hypothetical protein
LRSSLTVTAACAVVLFIGATAAANRRTVR